MLRTIWYVEIILSALVAVEFVIAYHRQTEGTWRRRVIGQQIMLQAGALAVVLSVWSIAVVIRFAGHTIPGWYFILVTTTFVLILFSLVRLRILLARIQGRLPKEEIADGTSTDQ
jgi:hypothetical protein